MAIAARIMGFISDMWNPVVFMFLKSLVKKQISLLSEPQNEGDLRGYPKNLKHKRIDRFGFRILSGVVGVFRFHRVSALTVKIFQRSF
jgi:hypothetical protein